MRVGSALPEIRLVHIRERTRSAERACSTKLNRAHSLNISRPFTLLSSSQQQASIIHLTIPDHAVHAFRLGRNSNVPSKVTQIACKLFLLDTNCC